MRNADEDHVRFIYPEQRAPVPLTQPKHASTTHERQDIRCKLPGSSAIARSRAISIRLSSLGKLSSCFSTRSGIGSPIRLSMCSLTESNAREAEADTRNVSQIGQTNRDMPGTKSKVGVAYQRGVDAEAAACCALERDGWTVLARRLRTEAGEIDIVAAKADVLAIVEVKARKTLADAAFALGSRQTARLLAAAEIVIAEHPDWIRDGIRFDLILVDAPGNVRRIADAFRLEN